MIAIDFRKLISFGKGSYIISMPKDWIEKNRLKKGDLISISDGGYELVLTAGQEKPRQESSEISIDVKGKDLEAIKADIVSSYLNGYDTVNIILENNNKDILKVKDVIRNLSGLEIMEQTSTRIVAKNLININEISISNIMRRMDIITRAMMEDVIACARDQRIYDNINNRDTDINRLYYLGYRVIKNALKNPRIAKALGIDPWQLHLDITVLKKIERIADKQKRIARYLIDAALDRKNLMQLESIHTGISKAYNEVMKSYYIKDRKTAFDIELASKAKADACSSFLENYTKSYCGTGEKGVNSKLAAVVKIIENLKSTVVETRDVARTIICYE